MNKTRERIQNLILLLTDLACLLISYYLSGAIWLTGVKRISWPESRLQLWNNLLEVVLALLLLYLVDSEDIDFTNRGNLKELGVILKRNIYLAGFVAVQEVFRRNSAFPRGVYVLTFIFSIFLMLLGRALAKHALHQRSTVSSGTSRCLMIAESVMAEEVLKNFLNNKNWMKELVGVIITDVDQVGALMHKIPVVSNRENMLSYIKGNAIDEVFINVGYRESGQLTELVDKLEDMGVVVHIRINIMDHFPDYDMQLGRFMGEPVVTVANRFYDIKKLAIKRVLDIFGGLVGLILTGILTPFVALAIKAESPGPIFFKQRRMGKNGRIFEIYKFRSMYIDAEERKEKLLAQNEMNGLMFKMKNDPRITKVGRFIRKTSIDEMPQFYNVLKGDMSLVGTRPPTEKEFRQYKGHYKRRLSMRPGITGMWQAYGRNEVMDFEKVVKMDLNYIDNWSLWLDVKILLKTVQTVFTTGGT